MKTVDVTKPEPDETNFWMTFSGNHNGKQYYFGLKKKLHKFQKKQLKAINQLKAFIKINTEDLIETNKSIGLFKELGSVFDVTL